MRFRTPDRVSHLPESACTIGSRGEEFEMKIRFVLLFLLF